MGGEPCRPPYGGISCPAPGGGRSRATNCTCPGSGCARCKRHTLVGGGTPPPGPPRASVPRWGMGRFGKQRPPPPRDGEGATEIHRTPPRGDLGTPNPPRGDNWGSRDPYVVGGGVAVPGDTPERGPRGLGGGVSVTFSAPSPRTPLHPRGRRGRDPSSVSPAPGGDRRVRGCPCPPRAPRGGVPVPPAPPGGGPYHAAGSYSAQTRTYSSR